VTARPGLPEDEEPALAFRVVWINDDGRQLIAEDLCRFWKGDAMRLPVPPSLLWIPFEVHSVLGDLTLGISGGAQRRPLHAVVR